MKKVLICSPSIGDFFENLAVADSICEFAANQGYLPMISTSIIPGRKTVNDIEQQHINNCDEVWLYCADGLAREMLPDLRLAVRAGKPVKLIREASSAGSQIEAADSYAEAPDVDDERRIEGGEGQPERDQSAMLMGAFSIDGLLLALRELDDIVGGVMPYEWWETVSHARGDYLGRLGFDGLMEIMDLLMTGGVLPHWPLCWKAELAAQFGKRDWLAELPELDRDNLKKIGDCDWHKLGHQLLLGSQYRRAFDFLAEAVSVNPQNYLAWSDIGQCAMNLGDLDIAIEAFQLSLQLAPANYYAWVGLGRCHTAMLQFTEAVAAFDQALACKADPSDPYVAELRAKAMIGVNEAANNVAI